jgi:hypothetical protein
LVFRFLLKIRAKKVGWSAELVDFDILLFSSIPSEIMRLASG